jgi:hypothetical protein
MNEFDDLDDLDEVLGPLRSVARPAELSQERVMVDLMVNAHRTAEGKRMFTSRRARVATLVAAGVLGFGGMAAASPSLSEYLTTEEPAAEQPPAEQPAAEEPAAEEPAAEEPAAEEPAGEEPAGEDLPAEESVEDPVVEELPAEESVEDEKFEDDSVLSDEDPDPETAFDERFCEEGNHGKTVSAVARGLFDLDGEYPGEVTVKMAAQSSCGKTDRDEGDTEMEIESEVESAESEKSEKSEPKAQRPGRSDKGAERASSAKSNGNGSANANGNGNGNGNAKRGG